MGKVLALVVMVAALGALAMTQPDAADARPSRAALEQRVFSQQVTIRDQRKQLRALRARVNQRESILRATWLAIGVDEPDLRDEALSARVAEILAVANGAAAAAQAALAGGITQQIAALPGNGFIFRDVLSALCSRARTGGVGYNCSIFSSPEYSSYTFDRF